jgi:hypothetical protein
VESHGRAHGHDARTWRTHRRRTRADRRPSKPEFEAAVRQALRDYTHPEKLELNPLRRSRLFVDDPSPARLQALLREALDDLKVVGRDEKFYRALLHTFFEPAATRELAAERLGLPFNTYRYQIGRGTERVVEWLWRRESGPTSTAQS